MTTCSLADYLDTHAIKPVDFARKIGVPPSTVSRIVKPGHIPTLAIAFAVEDATEGRVPARSFLTPVSRRKPPSKTKRAARRGKHAERS